MADGHPCLTSTSFTHSACGACISTFRPRLSVGRTLRRGICQRQARCQQLRGRARLRAEPELKFAMHQIRCWFKTCRTPVTLQNNNFNPPELNCSTCLATADTHTQRSLGLFYHGWLLYFFFLEQSLSLKLTNDAGPVRRAREGRSNISYSLFFGGFL